MAQRLIPVLQQIIDSSNVTIAVGYQLYTYETGTTTPKATYSDEALTTAQTNPLVVNADGYFASSTSSSQTNIWVSDKSLYKIVLTDSNDIVIATYDPVDAQTNSLTDFDPMPTVYMGTTSGTGSAYTLTSDVGLKEYLQTQSFFITFHATCNASPTINIDGLGAIGLYKYQDDGSTIALSAGDIHTGQTYPLNWNENGTQLVITVLQSITTPDATISSTGLSYLPEFITITNTPTSSTNQITFGAGNFQFSDGSGQARLSSNMIKDIHLNWVSGSGNGGLFSGTVAANTWYHCWMIYNPTTSIVDAGFDVITSGLLPPNLPSGYTKYSYRGSILTDSSANILAFIQNGNIFYFANAITNYSGNSPTSSTTLRVSVPTGFILTVLLSVAAATPTSTLVYFMRFIQNGQTPATPTVNNSQYQLGGISGLNTSINFEMPTDAGGQIAWQATGVLNTTINTWGYIIPSNILY
jgi:hypothetical protein